MMARLWWYFDPPSPNLLKKVKVKVGPPLALTFWIRAWLYFILSGVFSISTQLSLSSSLVDRHNMRSLALNIEMKPGPTVEVRRLSPSQFMLLKVE